jgi:glycerol-3-phosphate dehydrogenase (NAD(P)+)
MSRRAHAGRSTATSGRAARGARVVSFQCIAVIGAGAWGTALANCAARAEREVTLWARDPATIAAIMAKGESPRLPGVTLDERVAATGALADVARADAVLLVVPAQDLRTAAIALGSQIGKGVPVVACAKGIERGTHRFMTEVIAETLPDATPAILSGPSFAADVARGLPTAVTLACADEATAEALTQALGSATFRPYHSTDVRGVEIGGAAKNVLAIAPASSRAASSARARPPHWSRAALPSWRASDARSGARRDAHRLSGWATWCSVLVAAVAQLLARARAREGAQPTPSCRRRVHGGALVELAGKEGRRDADRDAVARCSRALSVDAAIESLLTRPFRASRKTVVRRKRDAGTDWSRIPRA